MLLVSPLVVAVLSWLKSHAGFTLIRYDMRLLMLKYQATCFSIQKGKFKITHLINLCTHNTITADYLTYCNMLIFTLHQDVKPREKKLYTLHFKSRAHSNDNEIKIKPYGPTDDDYGYDTKEFCFQF